MAKLQAMFFDCMDLFCWENFPVFRRDDWLCSFMSNDMYQVRCSCKTVKRITDLYADHPLAKRKADQRAYTIRRFPTFVQDCEVWGDPMVLIPLPTWRVWRVREWWFVVRGRLWPRTGWRLMETHWLRNLSEMAKLEDLFGGLCTYVRFEVCSYTWEYEDRWWVEEDHV